MFSEILDSNPMETLLSGSPDLGYPAAGDPAWGQIAPVYREEIEKLADEYRERPYPMRLPPNSWRLCAREAGQQMRNPIFSGGGSCAFRRWPAAPSRMPGWRT